MNQERVLYLYDTITNQSVAPILAAIIECNIEDDSNETEKREPIHLYINSGGGVMYDANALLSAMDSSKTPIYTYCHGYAMSAALTIFVGGHKRFAGKHATFMLHQPNEKLGEDKLFVLENRIEETKRLMSNRIQYIWNRTNLTLKDFEDKKYIDWFVDSVEALDKEIVHQII
ncbi:hypothetical protein BSK59_13870 [Paenibacillus odorifer]|uniref:ATP-dependent Clp protease proteolytic subunit n=1 Tax=Paenibacillus odorifer TaxID=189426 RepID=UPI00096F5011|nr:ATP-dependent Clp protease proteolytic subunit [Paenibacillus odorifer]OME55558.1 hypothetical protein BSK59_13870 [Paenibacillus odorifer]